MLAAVAFKSWFSTQSLMEEFNSPSISLMVSGRVPKPYYKIGTHVSMPADKNCENGCSEQVLLNESQMTSKAESRSSSGSIQSDLRGTAVHRSLSAGNETLDILQS